MRKILTPTVAITSPGNDTNFTTPTSITINATAGDNDGSVVKVDFYNGNALLGTANSSPYAFIWNNVAPGKYSLQAKATDNDGLTTFSDTVHISVSNPNQPPTVTITTPSANANFTSPASININATAGDSDGSVVKVDFYSGNTLLATQNTSPYTLAWNNVGAGNYVLIARATDNGGLVTSDSVNISVTNANGAPTVTITSPAANANFTEPANITISANAADADGSVTKVEFYNGSTLLTTRQTSPYSFAWNNVAAGKYVLRAKATDNGGLVTYDSVTIYVTTNKVPAVSITNPLRGETFTAPASVDINVDAADTDGSVVKVDFYNGKTLLGTQNTKPYSFTWNNVAAGDYVLMAVATDDGGLAATDSLTIHVTNINGAPKVAITSPAANAKFITPASITISASASDSLGSVSKVDFLSNGILLGTDSISPYTFTWKNVAEGKYSLTAKATNNTGSVTLSDSVAISVVKAGAPTVSITTPLPNAGFATPASINIEASAADGDGNVTRVDFYSGSTLIGTDMSAPYSFLWKNVVPGTYVLTAKATDNSNLVTVSKPVTVYLTAPNIAPVISITSPITNTVFSALASINISAVASDIDGSIAKVEFYNGTILLKTQFTFPYSFSWNNVPLGNYIITAKATDNNGRVTTSAPVAISLIKLNIAPKVSITSPQTNAGFLLSALININASASDSDGSVAKVDFYIGNILIGTDNTSPYSSSWISNIAGSYALTAKATDNKGSVTSSAAVIITVRANKNPAVSIITPVSNAHFNAPASVTISAAAADIDGSVSKVEFYSGATLLKAMYTAPYVFTWAAVPDGNYTLTAKATDNNGATTTSSAVSISVTNPNFPPTVVIATPIANSVFIAPANITITALASDPDGTVTRVDFYKSTTLLGTSTTIPYSFTWKNVATGTYTLLAKATDNKGLSTSSGAITISVNGLSAAKVLQSQNAATSSTGERATSFNEDQLNRLNFKIGPNPTNKILSVFTDGIAKNKKIDMSVLTVSGLLLKKISCDSRSPIIQVNVSSLIPGNYLLRLKMDDAIIYRQFEKQ